MRKPTAYNGESISPVFGGLCNEVEYNYSRRGAKICQIRSYHLLYCIISHTVQSNENRIAGMGPNGRISNVEHRNTVSIRLIEY